MKFDNKKDVNNLKKVLKDVYDYMKLNMSLEKSDLIIGCGCSDLNVPITCAQLYKDGYASKILFVGNLGKRTKENFSKSEAETFKDIAIKYGVNEKDIILETKSTNTGDNFRFSEKILNDSKIKWNKIIIVHRPFNE